MKRQKYLKNTHRPRFKLKKLLKAILDVNNSKKSDGVKVASHRTQELRAEIINQFFSQLHAAGYMIENPANLSPTHAAVLINAWARELKPSTFHLKVSVLRTFAKWIKKPTLLAETEKLIPHLAIPRRKYTASTDKSWSAVGIDWRERALVVEQKDRYVAMQIRLIGCFGLRRKEAVMLRPALADCGNYLLVTAGTKNSRDRVVPIQSDEQRTILESAKNLVLQSGQAKSGFVANPNLTLKQNLRKYDNVLRRIGKVSKTQCGVSGHGLRAEYICDRLTEAGIVPPARGGGKGQTDKDTEELIYRKISEEVGHSRKSILGAYCGSFRNESSAEASGKKGNCGEVGPAGDACLPSEKQIADTNRVLDIS